MAYAIDTIWTFETSRFAIICTAEPEEIDPADSFEFAEDIEFARMDDPAHWFCAHVRVVEKISGAILGEQFLGGCSYHSFEEFVSMHRASDTRNTLASKASGISYCVYFPDMVREAIAEARATIERLAR